MRTVGSEILTPVEEADKGLRLKVQRITLGNYLSGIAEGTAVADLGGNTIVVQRIQQLVSSTLQRRTGLTSASDLMLWRNFIATVPTET